MCNGRDVKKPLGPSSPAADWSVLAFSRERAIEPSVRLFDTRPLLPGDPRRACGLRVGMASSFPSFEAVAVGGALVGFNVDWARELSQRLGPALSSRRSRQFVANLSYDALTVGRVDILISALVINAAREGSLSAAGAQNVRGAITLHLGIRSRSVTVGAATRRTPPTEADRAIGR